MTEQELMHYGIPGMRWGIRRRIQNAISQHRINKASRLSEKYGAKVGVGVSKRRVKGALRYSKWYRKQLVKQATSEAQNQQVGKKLTKEQRLAAQAKLEKAIAKINSLKVVGVDKREEGYGYKVEMDYAKKAKQRRQK